MGKVELVDGAVRAMAPASATHSIIQGNLVYSIGAHVRACGSPCRVAPEAPIRPAIGNRSSNTPAPDVAVTCAPPSATKTFDDPVLIIEVLSPSNGVIQLASTGLDLPVAEIYRGAHLAAAA